MQEYNKHISFVLLSYKRKENYIFWNVYMNTVILMLLYIPGTLPSTVNAQSSGDQSLF
jgi:hypothetical protein